MQEGAVEQLADEHRYGYLVKILAYRVQTVLRGELPQVGHPRLRAFGGHIIDNTERMQEDRQVRKAPRSMRLVRPSSLV